MIKRTELIHPNSCLNKAHEDEMVFVLIGRDAAAAATVEFWIRERIRLKKNKPDDPQIEEARHCVEQMRAEALIHNGHLA